MKLNEFVAFLEKKNFSLSAENGKLILKGDNKKLTKTELNDIKKDDFVINYIKSHKDELLEYITASQGNGFGKKSKDISSIYKLSGLQMGMLFHGLYAGTAGAYTEQLRCDLIGANTEVIINSWDQILKRHSILRSAIFYDEFIVPVQCVYREAKLPVTIKDLRGLTPEKQAEAVKSFEEDDRAKGFDFNQVPLMRLGLLQLSDDRYRMVWTSHHILFDGWSMSILMGEFLSIYETLLAGKTVEPVEEDLYEDYIKYLDRLDKNVQENYWRNYMEGLEQGTLLPFIGTTAERTKGKGSADSFELIIDKETTSKIEKYVQKNLITTNTFIQGIWSYLLHYYTGSNDIAFGVIVSGRPDDLPGVEHRVGMYINTLPLHSSYKEEEKVSKWLLGIQEHQFTSRQHQYTPLSDIQSWSNVRGDLFDTILVFENYPVSEIIGANKWSMSVENIQMDEMTNYPLSVIVGSSEEISMQFNFNPDLLKEEYVKNICSHFENVIKQILTEDELTLQKINPLSESEENKLLTEFNNRVSEYPKDKSITELFEEQAAKNPDDTGLVFEDHQLTYKELNDRSNKFAHYLKSKGVKDETLVPLCLERSIDLITGILGILKAGGAYVPIDMEYPAERIKFMLEDTGGSVIIAGNESSELLKENEKLNIINIDSEEVRAEIDQMPDENLMIKIKPDQLAYIIYTSGSTGWPKGVMVTQKNVVSLVKGVDYVNFAKDDVLLSTGSTSFDATTFEYWGMLLNGGQLVLCKESRLLDSELLKEEINLRGVTTMWFTSSWFNQLVDNDISVFKNLRTILAGGEKLSEYHIEKIRQTYPDIQIINGYGPTENTTFSLTYNIKEKDLTKQNKLIPIGRPLNNRTAYILNGNMKPVPVGVTGEIYLGGDGVSNGYLNNSDLTKEKFVNDPFSKKSDAELYKTGDLGRWLPDGNIEYLGRADEQVKIRGYRIELGEIESALQECALVKQAAVLVKESAEGSKRLVGYIVPEGEYDKDEIVKYLGRRLPDYMVPAIWIQMENLPLTKNGKVDRRALPEPEGSDLKSKEYEAPRNELETSLTDLWGRLLQINKVGIHDNFFELGGHSLLAMRVISSVRKDLGYELAIKDLFLYPNISDLAKHLESQNKKSLLPAIEVQQRPELIPLSFSQERLWFIDRLGGSIQYHIPAVLKLKGALNKEALANALQSIINRHEVIRTVIQEVNGNGYQKIKDKDTWELKVIDDIKFSENSEELKNYINDLILTPFNLSEDHMLRCHLIKLNDDEHILVITMHHIASDGWSTSIIVNELVEFYRAFEENREPNLNQLQIQFADYSIWQKNYLKGEVLEEKIDYWKDQLQSVEPLQIPTDFTRPAVQSINGAFYEFNLDKDLSDSINELSKVNGATLFMTLLSAFDVLLYRYSGQNDISVGTPIAGRMQEETEDLIGYFINTLALRNEVKNDIPFTELLNNVKATTLEAYEHQDVPFEKVVEAVVKHRDQSRSPLFQVMFVFQNTPKADEFKLGDVSLSFQDFENKTTMFDISLNMYETPEGLSGSFQYCTDLFTENTIKRMSIHFNELLRSIVKSPEQKAGLLPILSETESEFILSDFAGSDADYPKDKSIVDLIEEQAAKTPDNTALEFNDSLMTYKELNERSNKLAHYLSSKGLQEETFVPLCIERGFDMIVGILGILKAGCAYVPVDPEYPEDRIRYVLEDTNASVILSSKESNSKIPLGKNIEIIILDENNPEIENESDKNPDKKVKSQNLCYVIYTSGSTGKPKGVLIEHRTVVNLINAQSEYFNITEEDRILMFSNYSFDASVEQMYLALTNGASLVLFREGLQLSQEEFNNYLVEKKITHLHATPVFLESIITDNKNFPDLKRVIAGGDVCKKELSDYWRDKVSFYNEYGPTETTVTAIEYNVSKSADILKNPSLPIGKPLANIQVYILDKNDGICPVGVSGEICISGECLARGYLNLPELTAEKFVVNPFYSNGKDGGKLMYRTGDIGRWLEDGNIEYSGRNDDQVKIRGYRIELGEIESIIKESGLAKSSVVLAKEDNNGVKRLIGYVVSSNSSFDKQIVISHLKSKLPDYMIPMLWVELENLPLTSGGKVDRKALPDPDVSEISSNEYVAPVTETEIALTCIWQELLNVDKIGIHDNFFELGGHSLLAMRVISMVRKEIGSELSIKDLFQNPNIAELAKTLVTQNKKSLLPAVEVQTRPEKIPLSFSQERLWFIDRLVGSVQYHLPSVLKLKGKLNKDALTKALQSIINRHEVIRTVIEEIDGKGYQKIKDKDTWELQFVDDPKLRENGEELQKYVSELIAAPFDLSNDHMLRCHLLKLNDDEHLLVMTMHHIASDGWSISIIVDELVEFYRSIEENREPNLQPLEIQYADFAIWQKNYLRSEVLEDKLVYWKNQLEAVEPIQLPTDFKRPAEQSVNGNIIGFSLEKELTYSIKELTKANGATLFITLLSAFNILLYKYSRQNDICVGTPIAGRQQVETEKLIGFFINTLALRNEVNDEKTFKEFLNKVKTTTLEAYEHQDVPFEKIVEAVVKQREQNRNPLVQIAFSLVNTPEIPQLKLGDLVLSNEEFDKSSSVYDLTLQFLENSGGLHGTIQYSTDLFSEETIEGMIAHYKELLNSIVKSPEQKIGQLSMLSKSEEDQLLIESKGEQVVYPRDKTIVDLFEEQVAINPDNIAVVYKDKNVTYKELNERSNRLAQYLISKGLKEQDFVPLCIERGIDMITGILGILKAGGIYVPVDPDYPAERVNYMIEDTGASIVVSSNASSIKILKSNKLTIIETDLENEIISKESPDNLNLKIKPENVAYVIYTSGSTGNPKGVLVENRNVVRLFKNDSSLFDFNDKDVWTMFHSFCFDFSVWEMYGALFYGGKLIIVPKDVTMDPVLFSGLIKSEGVTVLNQIPIAFNALQGSILNGEEKKTSIRYVIFGGEALEPSRLLKWKDTFPECKLINMYGITETTVHVTYIEIDRDIIESGKSIIGKAIPTLSIYVTDSSGKLLPVGIPGELCVGGAGVARGYLNRPELTSERFIKNPFGNNSEDRLYRSGDLGRRLRDGNIEYMGRIDEQVKIRGHRIELGEIESQLTSVEGVKDARVVVFEGKSIEDRKLNAYLQIDEDKLLLLKNYLELVDKKGIKRNELFELPNGLPFIAANQNEVKFLYNEIFEDQYYLKNGIVLSKNSCVLDIGANVGFFSIFLNLLDDSIKVYSFEPIDDVYNYMDANRKLYNVKGKSFQLALLDEEKEIEFVYYPSMSILSGVSEEMKSVKEVVRSYIETSENTKIGEREMEELLEAKLESKTVKCKAKRLSGIIAEEKIEKIDLLKIDVENSEHLVLAGLDEKDWDKIDNVIIEIHDVDGRLNKIQKLLESKGFRIIVEKEKMLSKDSVLYNMYAVKNPGKDDLTGLEVNIKAKKGSWKNPVEFTKYVRTKLEKNLPSYMVPSQIILLDSFPLTSNGKLNKKALPIIDAGENLINEYVAPRNEIEKKLVDIWQNLLNVKKVGINDNFFELGGHSILALELFSHIEKLTGKKYLISSLFKSPTIKGLGKMIEDKTPASAVQFKSLVEVKPGGSKLPLYYVPNAGGTALQFNQMAKYISEDQPVFVLESIGLDGKEKPHTDLRTMASFYNKEIKLFQPKGPYLICGRCFGGRVAYEMAYQFMKAGEEVALLAILDTWPPFEAPPVSTAPAKKKDIKHFASRSIHHIQTGKILNVAAKYLAYKGVKIRRSVTDKVEYFLADSKRRLYEEIKQIHFRAQDRYVAAKYPGKIVLIENGGYQAETREKWRNLALGGLETYSIPDTDHYSVVMEPQIQEFVEKLNFVLEKTHLEIESKSN